MSKKTEKIKYFDHKDYKNIDDFWKLFSELDINENKEYIKAKASNSISISNIIFPSFEENTLKDYFFTSNSQNQEYLIFDNCIFDEKVDFSAYNLLRTITITNCIFYEKVDLSVKKIDIDNTNFNSDLLLKDMTTKGKSNIVTIKNSSILGTLKIKNCHLENAQFYNLDLSKATLEIIDTYLIGMKYNNIKWTKNYNCNRDTFRQLKVVMENQKNFIDANIFHSLELNEHRKELSTSGTNMEDKILFNFNWMVSKFSRSWSRPLILLILFSVLLYCILCFFNLISECSINDFFKFFNPFSKTSNTDYGNIYWIWFLHKIISGFLIYHFIISLKRHTRI